MSRHGLTPDPDDEQPVDLGAVAADDALLEALLAGDLDATDDAALAALGALLDDVSTDLPAPAPVAVPLAPVLPLRRRRSATRTALAAVVGVGVLSAGGVAAAEPGSPLRPLRDVVADVVSGAASAVTGVAGRGPAGERDTPRAASSPTASPTPSPSPTRSAAATASPTSTSLPSAGVSSSATPGATASSAPSASSVAPRSTTAASNRSRSAALQADGALDRAQRMLDDGKTRGVQAQLDTAERLLRDVLPGAERTALQRRLDGLRTRYARTLDAERPPRAATPAPDRTAQPGRPTAKPERSTRASRPGKAAPPSRRSKAPRAVTVEVTRAPRATPAPGGPQRAADRVAQPGDAADRDRP